MRMPRSIPVNSGTRLQVIGLDPNFLTSFIRAAIPTKQDALKDRKLGAYGKIVSYLWTGIEYFWVEHDDGTTAVYSHSEVRFDDPRVYLPDCKECGCFAVSHIPRRSSKLRIKCTSCQKCEGYVHPTESVCNPLNPDVYYDPELGRFERFED